MGGQAGRDRVVDAAGRVRQAERDGGGECVTRLAVPQREQRGTGQVLERGVDGVVGPQRLGEVEEVRGVLRTGVREDRRGQPSGHDESFEVVVGRRAQACGEVCGGRHRPPLRSSPVLSVPTGSRGRAWTR